MLCFVRYPMCFATITATLETNHTKQWLEQPFSEPVAQREIYSSWTRNGSVVAKSRSVVALLIVRTRRQPVGTLSSVTV